MNTQQIFPETIRNKLDTPEISELITPWFKNILVSLQLNKPTVIEELFDWETEDVIWKIKAKMRLLYGNEDDKTKNYFH
jgi:hypothetical protein